MHSSSVSCRRRSLSGNGMTAGPFQGSCLPIMNSSQVKCSKILYMNLGLRRRSSLDQYSCLDV